MYFHIFWVIKSIFVKKCKNVLNLHPNPLFDYVLDAFSIPINMRFILISEYSLFNNIFVILACDSVSQNSIPITKVNIVEFLIKLFSGPGLVYI